MDAASPRVTCQSFAFIEERGLIKVTEIEFLMAVYWNELSASTVKLDTAKEKKGVFVNSGVFRTEGILPILQNIQSKCKWREFQFLFNCSSSLHFFHSDSCLDKE